MSEQGKAADVGVTKPAQEVHPLSLRKVPPIRNWNKWLELWCLASSFQMMESLLHCGFDTPIKKSLWGTRWPELDCDEEHRLLFYLSVAEGWVGSSSKFGVPDEDGIMYEVGFDEKGCSVKKFPYELRQQLATKAFYVLCSNFFKRMELKGGGRNGDDFNERWRLIVDSDRLFGAIKKFFRAESSFSGRWSVCNLRIRAEEYWSQREQQAVTFLLNLATFLWGWREEVSYSNHLEVAERNCKTRAIIDAAKPWMVEVLVSLRKMDLLYKHIFGLDEACLAKLKEIALSTQLSHYDQPVAEDRKVETVDEACYAGSLAAEFLVIHEIKNRVNGQLGAAHEARLAAEAERRRLSKIREAEEAVDEANRRVEELKGEGSAGTKP